MTKLLEATCDAAGIVTAESVQVPAAEVLSAGKKASSGILLLDGEKAKYLTSNASDIKDLIESLVAIIQQIETIALALDAVSTSPGSTTAATAALTALRTSLDASKELLK